MDDTRPSQSTCGWRGSGHASSVVIDPISTDVDHRIISALVYDRAHPRPQRLRRQHAVSDLSAHVSELVDLDIDAPTHRTSSGSHTMISSDRQEVQGRSQTHDVSTGYFPFLPENLPPVGALRFPRDNRLLLPSDNISKCGRPSRIGFPQPNALRSHPSQTRPGRDVLEQRRHSRVVRRFCKMSILPTLDEASEEIADLPSPSVMATNHVPDHVHLRKPRGLSYAETEYLTAANISLKAENRLLNSTLQNAVSQHIITADQLQQLQQEHGATQEALKALWTAAMQVSPELQNTSTMLAIRSHVHSFEQRSSSSTSQNTAVIKQNFAQQTKYLSQDEWVACQRASGQRADKLAMEIQRSRAQLDNIEAEQRSLKARLDIAEEKAARLERYLIQCPRV